MHLHRLFDLLLISSLGRSFFPSLSLSLSVAIPFSPYFTCFFPERGHATFPRQAWSFDVHQRRKSLALYWCNRRSRNLMFILSGVYISRRGNWAGSKSYQRVLRVDASRKRHDDIGVILENCLGQREKGEKLTFLLKLLFASLCLLSTNKKQLKVWSDAFLCHTDSKYPFLLE